MVNREPVPTEFSRVVMADSIGPNGLTLDLEATPREAAELARRFDLEALSGLRACAKLHRAGEGKVRLEVTFDADVLQLCVITLEPVASHVSDLFEVVFAPPGEDKDETEVFVDPADNDPPERLLDGEIDVGEMIAQHLSLRIDPYPRAPDAQGGNWESGGDAAAEPRRPFERLRGFASKG